MKILYIAEIVGKAGMWLIKTQLKDLKRQYNPDFVIANANSATGSGGLGRQHAGYLKKLGADCLTLGDSAFQKRDLVDELSTLPYVLRPVNLPEESPGSGMKIFSVRGKKLAVISALGRVGKHRITAENPYTTLDKLVQSVKKNGAAVFIDFASFATAEKQALCFMLAGKVSAVIGSGTRVQTADLGIVSDKTVYITDAGRTGSLNSVGGYAVEDKIREYKTCLPDFGKNAWARPVIQGIFLELDKHGGALTAERIFKEAELCGNPEQ